MCVALNVVILLDLIECLNQIDQFLLDGSWLVLKIQSCHLFDHLIEPCLKIFVLFNFDDARLTGEEQNHFVHSFNGFGLVTHPLRLLVLQQIFHNFLHTKFKLTDVQDQLVKLVDIKVNGVTNEIMKNFRFLCVNL